MISVIQPYINALKAYGSAMLQIICAPRCWACKQQRLFHESLCTPCIDTIQPIVTTRTNARGYEITVHAVSAYQEPIDILVRAKIWKDRNAAYALANIMWSHSSIRHIPFDAIIWVPNHWTRTIMRGYDVSKIIAQRISQLSKKPTVNAVRKIRRTPFQSLANAAQRATQQQDCFQATKQAAQLTGKTILIIDDVYTTGHTIKQLIKSIHTTKPKAIYVATACRTL